MPVGFIHITARDKTKQKEYEENETGLIDKFMHIYLVFK